ncbi:MAG: twin-arginine translocase subunit TatB [Burkholderiales bacterium]|nr:twin-arginine translocase subunit TatB [Burkholderiales bacterium]
MFDISLFEMVVIGIVALIVIGPERLPGVARTVGHLFGRMQRYVNEVKSDIQREIELDELKKLRESVEDSAREIEQSMSRELDRAEHEVRELQEAIEPASHPAAGELDLKNVQAAAPAVAGSSQATDVLADTAAARDVALRPDAPAVAARTGKVAPKVEAAAAATVAGATHPDSALKPLDAARSGMPVEAAKSANPSSQPT